MQATANPESKENGILACFYDPDDTEIAYGSNGLDLCAG